MTKITDEEIESSKICYKDNNDSLYTLSENPMLMKICRDCGSSCYTTYLTLLMHNNNKENKCCPKLSTIMKECSISKTTLLSHLKNLEEYGYIKIKSGGNMRANYYYFPKANKNIVNYSEEEMQKIKLIERKQATKNSPTKKSIQNLNNQKYKNSPF